MGAGITDNYPEGGGMNKSPDKHYADEFFMRTTKPLSKAEYEKQPVG